MKGPRGPKHSHVRDRQKQEEAAARQKARDDRSAEQQLSLLDGRRGQSLKERRRLAQ